MTTSFYPRCDRAFDPAIEKGYLTVQQAIERGDRAHYASKLQKKYGLDEERALLVTDNIMSLADALASRFPAVPAPVQETPAGSAKSSKRGAVQFTTAVLIMALGAYVALRQNGRSNAPVLETVATEAPSDPVPETVPALPAPTPELVAFQVDPGGLLTEITGPDPKSVLISLCSHPQFAETLVPMALAPAVPPSPGARFGLIVDLRDTSVSKYVAIHRNARTGRWSAGNGDEPLEIQLTPQLPPGTVLTPL